MKPLVCAALMALAVMAAPSARAFTLDTVGGSTDGAPGLTDPNPGAKALRNGPAARPFRNRSDWLDPTKDPDRLPPIPEGARIGAGEYGFGNNSRFGYDRSGRPR